MYEIKVLNSKEFDEMAKSDKRYSFVDASNMGFADVEKNRVFVRDTGIHELNRYLINHEIDHLVEEHATDVDANGIRHKKFFKEFLAPLFTGFNLETGNFSPAGIFGDTGKKEETTVSGGMEGTSNSPFGNFTINAAGPQGGTASQGVSETVTGGVQGGLNPGISGSAGSSELRPELLQKLKGNYSGRMVF